jgi:hypothetical protein
MQAESLNCYSTISEIGFHDFDFAIISNPLLSLFYFT